MNKIISLYENLMEEHVFTLIVLNLFFTGGFLVSVLLAIQFATVLSIIIMIFFTIGFVGQFLIFKRLKKA